MAYIRSKVIKGNTYFYLVEGVRHGDKVKQRVIQYLGRRPWGHFYPSAGGATRGDPLPVFKGFTDLATKILDRLRGRDVVSRQYITDLVRAPDIRKAKRALVDEVLHDAPDTMPMQAKSLYTLWVLEGQDAH